MLRAIYYCAILLSLFFSFPLSAQITFPWSGTYGGAGANRTYTTTVSGITMSATINNSENVWQDGSPVWFPTGSAVSGGGCAGIAAINQGILLSTDWSTNTTKTITTTITFSSAIKGPVNFKLYDINDDGFGSWADKIVVTGTNAASSAVNIFNVGTACVSTGGSVTGSGTSTLTYNSGISSACTCWGNNEVNVGTSTDCIKTITILYKSNVSPTNYNNPKQYVVISNLVASNATTVTAPTGITGTTAICSGGSTTLTATGGNASTQWYTGSCNGTSAGTGASITVSPGSTTTYYAANSNGCATSTCASATVTVSSPPNAGTDGSTSVCESSVSSIDLFSLITGENSGGTWTQLTGSGGSFNAGAGTFTPAIGATTSTFQYTVTGTAPCSNDISSVTITITSAPNAGTSGSANFCSNGASADLFSSLSGSPAATGTWSGPSALTGGNLGTYNPATMSPGTYTYTVTGSGGCANATATVSVSESVAPNAGTDGSTSVCETSVSPVDLYSLITGEDAGGTWSQLTGSGGTFNAGTGTFTPAAGSTTSTFQYTVTGTAPCSNDISSVTLTITSAPDAGTDGALTICQGSTVTSAELFAALTGTPDAGGTWSPALAGAGVYTYTVTVAGCTDATASVTVTEQAQPNAGTDGTLPICQGTVPTNAELFAALLGTPDAGGTWSNVGLVYTYTVAATAPCATDATSTVTVTEQTQPNAGLNGTLDICAGTTVTSAELFNSLTGTPDAGGTWSPALAGAGTYTYTVTATAPCATDATSQVVVTEQAQPNAGTDGTLTICQGTVPTNAELFAALLGTPDAGGTWSNVGLVYTYTVAATAPCATDATSTVTVTEQTQPNAGSNGTLDICAGTIVTAADLFNSLTGTPDAGGTWSPALAGAGTYTYTVTATAPCATDATAQVVVTEIAAPDAGVDGTLTICQGSTVTSAELFAALTGIPDAGGTWSPALAGAGVYTYTVTVAGCTDATASVTVTEQAQPNAGTDGTLTICQGTVPTNAELFAALTGTPDAGGTWSNVGLVYTYTVAATAPCATDATSTVTVTEQTQPNAGLNGTLDVCAGATVTASDLFGALTGTPDVGGIWSPALAGAGTYTYTVTATAPCATDATAQVVVTEIAAPDAGTDGTLTICQGSTVTSAELFSALTGTPDAGGTWSPALAGAGVYTYTVTVAGCTDATASVTVSEQAQPNAGVDGTLTICQGTVPTNAELFAALTGTPDAGGTWSNVGLVYTYTVAATAPCATDATSTVTVTEQTQPNAGVNGTLDVCAGTTVTTAELFNALAGTPDAGGTWSPALAGAGTYTYTVTATAPCATDATAQVVVTEIAAPDAGTDGTLTICQGSTVTSAELFSALTGTPDAGGTWSPALAGAGVYTYTVTVAGCTDATASVTVSEQAQPNAGVDGTLTICQGTVPTNAELFAALTGTPDAGGTWSNVGLVYTYTVAATAPCATDATSTVTVTEQTQPNAGTNGTLDICAGTTVTTAELFNALAGTPDAGGTWSPALAGVGTYTYTVTATAPCATDAAAQIVLTISPCEVVIPTGFTPNGDGVNETWELYGLDETYPNNMVFIYNRWGNLVYESKQGDYASNPWDGTYEGKELPVSSFYYMIYTDPENEEEVMKGTISILKKE